MTTNPLPAWPPRGANGNLLPLDRVRHALIEASAGTGKTYQTEGLVVRLVVEQGIPIDRVLVITFTRAATAELRARVRERLVKARRRFEGEPAKPGDDEVLDALFVGTPAELAERRQRVENALRDYDRAPISTIHGFCQRMLEAEAFAASEDPQPEVTSDAATLRDRYIADVLCGAFAGMTEREAGMLDAQGLSQSLMSLTAKTITGAGNERFEPATRVEADGRVAPIVAFTREAAVLGAQEWRVLGGGVLSWLDSAEGVAAVEAYRLAGASNAPSVRAGKGELVKGLTAKRDVPVADLRAWLAKPEREVPPEEVKKNFLGLQKLWEDANAEDPRRRRFEDTALYPLVVAVRSVYASNQAWTLPDFAASARVAYERELAARGVMTYDAMITRLAAQLRAEDDQPTQPLRTALRARFDAALIDEFQDTDQGQWTIAHRAFLEAPDRFLYVVGDPKQAIYRFRGANLGVYLAAVAKIPARYSLVGNYRSDPALLTELNTAWFGAHEPFLDARIRYAPVVPAKKDRCRGLGAPLELRHADDLPTAAARYVKNLLDDETAQVGKKDANDPSDTTGRRVRPRDIAILCPAGWQLELIRQALSRVGIRGQTGSSASVFGSPAASWLLALLDALAAPAADTPARVLALSPLVGWSLNELGHAIEGKDSEKTAWVALRESIVRWAERAEEAGLMVVYEALTAKYGTLARLVGGPHGERAAADLRDLVERLHVQEQSTRMAPSGLAAWLRAQVAGASDDDETQMRTIETDADAVVLSTVHAAKGLQYPIVLLPYMWREPADKGGYKPVVYTPRHVTDGSRTVDLHPADHPQRLEAQACEAEESDQEKARVLYVAMTRAIHKVVMWADPETPDDFGAAFNRLADPARLRGVIAEPALAPASNETRELPPDPNPAPVATPWQNKFAPGAGWRITSFTGLSGGRGADLDEPDSGAPDTDIADERGESTGTDLPESADGSSDNAVDRLSTAAFLARLKRPDLCVAAVGEGFFGGTATGTWLHHLFEDVDFTTGAPEKAPDASLQEIAKQRGDRDGVTDATQYALAAELMPKWLATPLGGHADVPLPADFTLSKIHRKDRMDELKFDLRIAGGLDRRDADGKLRKVDPAGVRLVYQRAIDDGARSTQWLKHLLDLPKVMRDDKEVERNLMPPIAGMLTGSMDLVFRAPDTDPNPRYFVCDYKSNALTGGAGAKAAVEALGLLQITVPADRARGIRESKRPVRVLRAHYTEPMMAWGMAHHAYHLQALVYTVALHRHLRQRLGGTYDYDTHIGGHLYLFLRGMEGKAASDGEHLGVWADRWSKATVLGMDLVLAGATADEVKQALARIPAPPTQTGEGGRA
jgi:exodeoxyribonuclease V beta subunit